jgi:hypothetical protein
MIVVAASSADASEELPPEEAVPLVAVVRENAVNADEIAARRLLLSDESDAGE